MIGHQTVEVCHDAGHVEVQVPDACPGSGTRRDVGKIDAHARRGAFAVVDELAGHVTTDVDLGLLGRSPHVWGENDVVQALQLGDERFIAGSGLTGIDVHRGPGEMSGAQIVRERSDVDDMSARQVEEQRPRPHHRELLLTEEKLVVGASVHMNGDDVDGLQQLLETVAAVGIAHGELVRDVVIHDAQTERLGQHRDLGTDVSIPDDAQGAATHLVRPDGGLAPHPVMHLGVAISQPAGQGDDLGDHQLHDGAGVGERGVERRHPGVRQIIQGKLVGTNAEGPHRRQRLTAFRNDLGGDLGARSNAQQVDPVECLDEFVLTQCPGDTFNLVTSLAQGSYSLVMDVLEQKRLHAGQSREGAHRVSRDETTAVVCSSRPCEETAPSTLDEWIGQRP